MFEKYINCLDFIAVHNVSSKFSLKCIPTPKIRKVCCAYAYLIDSRSQSQTSFYDLLSDFMTDSSERDFFQNCVCRYVLPYPSHTSVN